MEKERTKKENAIESAQKKEGVVKMKEKKRKNELIEKENKKEWKEIKGS